MPEQGEERSNWPDDRLSAEIQRIYGIINSSPSRLAKLETTVKQMDQTLDRIEDALDEDQRPMSTGEKLAFSSVAVAFISMIFTVLLAVGVF